MQIRVGTKSSDMIERQCGDCQLCCRLLPVPPLDKKAGQRCKHQKFGKGCAVYHRSAMPRECAVWNCRWLVNDDTADLSRPDRVHYVIDIMPDFITLVDNMTGAKRHVQVVQIWCDPKHRDAHRDPALREYLSRRGAQGIAAIVRYDAAQAMVLIPPQLAHDGKWHEATTGIKEKTHTLMELLQALGEKQQETSR